MESDVVFGDFPRTAMRLHSLGWLDLADPNPAHIRLEDIAFGLARIGRFGAQCEPVYTVAQHSVACFRTAVQMGDLLELPQEITRAVLLHDAAEAYVGDCIRPMRILLPKFKEIERRVMHAVCSRFSLDPLTLAHPLLRQIDDDLLRREYHWFFERVGEPIQCLDHDAAEAEFLAACAQIGIEA